MKIDKSNPLHWFYLGVFTLNVCLVLLLRLVFRPKTRNVVVLYGHKLNGNLLALQAHAHKEAVAPDIFFLTLDPVYYRQLRQGNSRVLSGLNPFHMIRLLWAYAIVSDHGLHSLILFLKFSHVQFVDVWHGIPFKGFGAHDFRVQHCFREVWVASDKMKHLYVNQFGFPEDIVQVTGYARTDKLALGLSDSSSLKGGLSIPCDKKVILFAPTWQQDDKNRSVYPFGLSEHDFLERMSLFCERNGAICIVRKHLNMPFITHTNYQHIYMRPSCDFPDTESILLISDLLICDWSSIAFDYLLLNRPALFLDVPPPFDKGFSLDASFRFGRVVKGDAELFSALTDSLMEPGRYFAQYAGMHQKIRQELYGDMADGQAAARCLARLSGLR